MSAPASPFTTDYDRAHVLTYARMLDAANANIDWREAAAAVLGCDVANDPAGAEACWTSHLKRARWVVGEGLAQMVTNEP